ncbi:MULTISPECIES: DUF732 domain-containing protein [Rhodococcus]|uniref:DUF732 domain-containing protein n=1 Tax=Rhodococcus TaxID=1827 RepID=UPI000C99E29D|nr:MULTISPECIES: hypothetical protein [Rhodococcus]PND49817.1 hypothetical protein CQZ88_22655 [Rhodococcus sp. ENV425]WKW99586.1 DUF732 domain-containing protein [Rhodococcus aetherivorans]
MRLHALTIPPVLLLLAACGGGEATPAAGEPSSPSAPSSTTASYKPLPTRQDAFVKHLRAGGIYPSKDQIPLLIPAAVGNCDALRSTTLPDYQKFDKMVELSRILGAGKNVFDDQSTAEAFMAASIHAYCSDLVDLIPTRIN